MPTLINTYSSTNFLVGATNKDVTGIAWNAGDLIFIRGMTYTNTLTLSNPTNANLTITAVGTPTNTASTTKHYAWSAVAGSTQTSQTIACLLTGGANEGGLSVEIWRNHGGVGAVMTPVSGASGAPSATITTNSKSAISCQVGNFNQATGARTYLTNAGAAVEWLYNDDATEGTSETWYHANAGTAGAKTIGMSAPSGMVWWLLAAEILDASTLSYQPRRMPMGV